MSGFLIQQKEIDKRADYEVCESGEFFNLNKRTTVGNVICSQHHVINVRVKFRKNVNLNVSWK